MPVRTTDEAVGAIIEVDAEIPLTPFIEVASALVDDVIVGGGADYGLEKLERIERWLSAHYYAATRDPRASSEGAGPVNISYLNGPLGLFLQSTHWGQTALALDTDGYLAAHSKALEAGGAASLDVTWLGTDDYLPRREE